MAVVEVCDCCCSVLLTSGLDGIGAPSSTKKAREINMATEKRLFGKRIVNKMDQ